VAQRQHKLYTKMSSWFHLLTPPAEYAEEVEIYLPLLKRPGFPKRPTLLELGSGGGNNASHLKRHFRMTLSDLSREMLAVSRTLNPECEHVQGDMRTLRLGRTFDAVFVHDAVEYMTTEIDLRAAMETAFLHCKPGGIALFTPDHMKETFKPSTDHGGSDDGMRGLRYPEWTYDPDPADTVCTVEFACLLRDERGKIRVEHERHLFGLFPERTWMRLLHQVGFQSRALTDRYGRRLFLAVRPKPEP